METQTTPVAISNTPRKVYRIAAIIGILFIVCAFLVGNSALEGKGGKYALVMLLLFFAMAALVVTFMYIPRAKAFDQLMHQLQPLAHWTYSNEEWSAYLYENKKEMLMVNTATLRWAGSISLVVGALLVFTYRDSLFIVIIAGIILMMAMAAFIGPVIQTYFLRKGNKEAFIAKNCVYIGGSFYIWTQLGAHFVGADILTENVQIPMLHIIYEFPTVRNAFQQEIIRIPVQQNKMEEAWKIVAQLNNSTAK